MSLKTENLIEQINIVAPEITDLKDRVVAALGKSIALQDIVDRDCENRGQINCHPCENEGSCLLLQGIAHLDLGDIDSAIKEFENAGWHFRSQDEVWNGILGQLFLGKAHERGENFHQAFIEYKKVLESLSEHKYRFQNNYAELSRANELEKDIKNHLTRLIPQLSDTSKRVLMRPQAGSALHQNSYLNLYSIPLYGKVAAGPEGEVYLEPYENTSTIVERVELEGELFEIFSVGKTSPNDRQITLTPQQAYGWLKVRGLSMNGWELPFEENDYVLFQRSQTADHNDFVIVSFFDPVGDILLSVKRFDAMQGQFISNSKDTSKPYAPFPVDATHRIEGVVLAVAKLLKKNTEPEKPAQATNDSLKANSERYAELVILVQGDKSVADRLIGYEKRLSPNSTLADCIDRAITRLLDDRRL